MEAEIIAVGTEILIGQVLDTNSHYLAKELEALGAHVHHITVISDDRRAMRASFEQALGRSDVTLVTGGLGPTSDDFTQEVLMEIFGGELVENAEQLALIRAYFAARGHQLTETNRAQADVPSCCRPLINRRGTAPGMRFARGGHVLYSMPGVPFEMQAMFQESIRPELLARMPVRNFYRTFHVYGIAESDLSDRLQAWESGLSPDFALAYLPSPQGIRLRLTSVQGDTPTSRAHCEQQAQVLLRELGSYYFGEGEVTLGQAVAELLESCGATLSVAESCTGGMLSGELVRRPGASRYLRGSVTAYSIAVKEDVLGVSDRLITERGVVSGEVAAAMAEGVRKLLGTTWSVATTGALGPEGDGSAVPVGTVWIGVCGPSGTTTHKCVVLPDRVLGMEKAVAEALNALRLRLLDA